MIKSKNCALMLIIMRNAMTVTVAAVATHAIKITTTIIIPPGNSGENQGNCH
jgi:hypothetical protein